MSNIQRYIEHSLSKGVLSYCLCILFIVPCLLLISASATSADQLSANQWETLEIALTSAQSYPNPYTDVDVTAVFSGPGGIEKTVRGFWDGGSSFKVRFTPTAQGTWIYSIGSLPEDSGLTASGTISVDPPISSRGFVRIDPAYPNSFIFDNGDRYLMFGTTAYEFIDNAMDDSTGLRWKAAIDFFRSHGINKIRFAIYPWEYSLSPYYMTNGSHKYPDSQPFTGSKQSPDLDFLRIEHWQKLDEMIEYMATQEMVADLIIFPNAPRSFGTDDQDFRYTRYSISRFAAYSNVIWCLVNEYDLTHVAGKDTVAWWNVIGDIVHSEDPWHYVSGMQRALSITEGNSYTFDFFGSQWPGHASIQINCAWNQTEDGPPVVCIPDDWGNRGITENLNNNMPVVNDEYMYAGSSLDLPGDPIFGRRENRQTMWSIYAAGGYASMGDGYDELGRNAIEQGSDHYWGMKPWSHGDPYDVGEARGIYDDVKRLTDFFTAGGIEYWKMESRNDLITSGSRVYTLARPGSDYVLYDADGGTFALNLDTGTASYNVTRTSPASGAEQDICTVSGGEQQFRGPPDHDWVYHIFDNNSPPRVCTLNNAYWVSETALEGQAVQLIVEGNNCDGQALTYEIREDDSFEGNNHVITQPDSAIFIGDIATRTWISEYYPDGAAGDPEYYFTATLISDDTAVIDSQSNPLLAISEDLAAPSIPQNLQAAGTSSTHIHLSWEGSTDNVAIGGYRIIRDGVSIMTVDTEIFWDRGLLPSTAYTYTVKAIDIGGNESAESAPAAATTDSLPDSTWIDYFCDNDSDNYFDSTVTDKCRGGGCEPAGCHLLPGNDCNDVNSTIHPGAVETWYDGTDQNCDGRNDYDQDMDGYVDAAWNSEAGGSAPGIDDCDDSNAAINPPAAEIPYDGVDQDCSGADLRDVDSDGYDAMTVCFDDCNDGNSTIHPGAVETWYDGTDQDCDGENDYDQDRDGYVDAAWSAEAGGSAPGTGDCNDSDDNINPGAVETWYDGTDQDCDGKNDYDQDGDGYVDINWNIHAGGSAPGTDDCNDIESTVNPGAVDIADDGTDQDCSGTDTVTCIEDADQDGFGTDTGTTTLAADGACDAAEYESNTSDDCDDNDPAVHPGADEVCDDTLDNDCNGFIDVADPECPCTPAGSISVTSGQTLGGSQVDLTSIVAAAGVDQSSLIYRVTESGSTCNVNPEGTYFDAENYTDTQNDAGNFSVQADQEGYLNSGYLKTELPAEHTIFTDQTPSGSPHGPDSAVELGVKWTSDVDGYVTGVRFYKHMTYTGTHRGRLWQGAALLANAAFSNETGSEWQNVYFDSAVAVSAGVTYIVTYHSEDGIYYQSDNYFGAVDNTPLHVSAAAGQNGVYRYAPAAGFECAPMPCTPAEQPDIDYNANFWVDVIFVQSLPSCSDSAGREYRRYEVDFPAGEYTVWLRGYGVTGADTVLAGIDGSCMGTYQFTAREQWSWSSTVIAGTNSTGVLSGGLHHIDLWTRQPGVLIDGIYVTQGTETPDDAARGTEIDPGSCIPVIFSGNHGESRIVDAAGWVEGAKWLTVSGNDEVCQIPLLPASDTFSYIKCKDEDGDGYGSPGNPSCPNGMAADCDDNNSVIHPGAADICDDIDNDCDSGTADGVGESAPLNILQAGVCVGSTQSCMGGVWEDDYREVNGYQVAELSCDDLDNDCDGNVDEDVTQPYYEDDDSDTYGNPEVSQNACAEPAGYVINNTDCNDTDPVINPETLWYPDTDIDGYGNPIVSLQQCIQPAGFVLDSTDCDDGDPDIYPGGPPVRIAGTEPSYYLTLQEAYDQMTFSGTIQSKALMLNGNLTADHEIAVTFEGGFDCSYSVVTGTTTNNGTMTISGGTVTIRDFTFGD